MMSSECTISLSDYEEQYELSIRDFTEDKYYKKYDKISKDRVRIIICNCKVVGWMELSVPSSAVYDGFVFIYVTPNYRRNGIGTRVYKQVKTNFESVGCGWWTSYPPNDIADKFVKSVGFNFVNTNTYMEHDDKFCVSSGNGIRSCVPEDYPTALDIWSREYAEMHKRIGLLFEKKEMTEEECKEEYNDFLKNIENSFVMEIDGKIIGYGAIFEDNSGIGAVAIDREYAGRGYGTRLSAFLTNEIIRRGCKTPCLYCESGNDDAMHIYKKIGYYEVSGETVAIKTI